MKNHNKNNCTKNTGIKKSNFAKPIEIIIAPDGFEPSSRAPKARMLGRYTTGLPAAICFNLFYIE